MILRQINLVVVVAMCNIVLNGCSPRGDLTVVPQTNADGAESEWRKVSSKRGRFEVQMPGVPYERTNITSTPFGTITQHLVTVEVSGTIAYGISYFELPPTLDEKRLDKRWPEVLRETTRNAIIGSNGNLISEREFKLHGHDANELVLEKINGKAQITVQIYNISNRNYTLSVVMPRKLFVSPKNPKSPVLASNLMAHFFNSVVFQE